MRKSHTTVGIALPVGEGHVFLNRSSFDAGTSTMTDNDSIDLVTEIVPNERASKFPSVGAFHRNNTTTRFCVWAPLKQAVSLKVNGNNYALTKSESGYWESEIEAAGVGDKYVFVVDGEEIPDPASLSQPAGVHGPSQVIDRTFHWSDDAWTGLPLREMIIYELHVGTFTREGTFESIIAKIQYLKSLGINTIELMPIAQFPGDRNWGYDGVFPFAVQHSYGGAYGLKTLVSACHENGIAVILDVVYNHLGPEGNYVEKFGPYFTDKYKTGWGKAINFDDAYCDGVRQFYLQNALMWLDEFHLDGLRLDAVHAIWDFSAYHFIEELKDKVTALQERTGCTKILIAEFDLNNPRYINPKSSGGYAMDGQWIDEFHHALHSILTGETNGYYEDFGAVHHLAKALQDSYVYTGQYSVHRKKFFGRKTDNPYEQFIVFAQNHDQIGNRLRGDRLSQSLSVAQLKLAAAAYLLSPHVPMLFMGEEYGEKNPFQYFTSHTDEGLVQAVREGRKKEFEYFGWTEEIPDPNAAETFQQCKLSWNTEEKNALALLQHYRFLIQFRKNRKAMQGASRESLKILFQNKDMIGYSRSFEDDRIVIILNFSNDTRRVDHRLDENYSIIFESTSPDARPSKFDRGEIVLPPFGILILEFTK